MSHYSPRYFIPYFDQGAAIGAVVDAESPYFFLFGLRNEQSQMPHFTVYFERFYDPIRLPLGKPEEAL